MTREILKMSNLINKQAVRKLALMVANDKYSTSGLPDIVEGAERTWDWTRAKKAKPYKKYRQVSLSFLEEINTSVRLLVQERINKLDGKGTTIK
jgi:hypothetical protein